MFSFDGFDRVFLSSGFHRLVNSGCDLCVCVCVFECDSRQVMNKLVVVEWVPLDRRRLVRSSASV